MPRKRHKPEEIVAKLRQVVLSGLRQRRWLTRAGWGIERPLSRGYEIGWGAAPASIAAGMTGQTREPVPAVAGEPTLRRSHRHAGFRGRARERDAVLEVWPQHGEPRHHLRLASLAQGRERCRRSLPCHGGLPTPAAPRAVRKGIGQRTNPAGPRRSRSDHGPACLTDMVR